MILETTNPKFKTRSQIPAGRKFYDRPASEIYDGDFVGASSRSMAKGEAPDPHFVDRKPHEAPIPNREPEPRDRPRGSSMWLADESPDHPLWMIKDIKTGHVMARVRGSLPWIVDQMRLAAHQLGGAENDLFYQRVN
ncbi:hypothetical protein IB276_33040 [Ensifer sp. ENS04]|uniref:hypothetical protein n=1 Tax=Ensifer sp. ENS04 TaxID=2769281 RepID=UPI001782212D|nr:hypothetical protein [Ensifer sp. ENS04]MBD9544273.1 hypothetical protein [Ensifer sp. ENS04]